MEIGVNVPNFGPGTNPARLREWAQVVEGLGYDLLMVSDHVVITPDVAEQYPAPFYEPFTTLSWLAGITSRVRLGTTVLIAGYRHPLLVARMAANLQELSGGRLVLGVGAGWARQEFEAMGASQADRGRATDELLITLRKVWTDTVDYSAAPLWVGGGSTAAMRRAVLLGDAWHPLHASINWLRTATDRLHAIAAAEDRAVPALAPRIKLRLTAEPLTDRVAGEGTLDQIRTDLAVLRDLGATAVVLDTEYQPAETAWQALATLRQELS